MKGCVTKMKKYLLAFLVVSFNLFFVAGGTVALAQKVESQESIIIDKSKPSIYIRFERSGEAERIRSGDSKERFWLRLYNNTRWKIAFCSFSVESEYGDVGITYDVEQLKPSIDRVKMIDLEEEEAPRLESSPKPQILKIEKPPIPLGYRTGDTCAPFYLAKGKSVLFSIPRKHLAESLFINVSFWYDWENMDNELGSNPTHFVSFGNTQLPLGERK